MGWDEMRWDANHAWDGEWVASDDGDRIGSPCISSALAPKSTRWRISTTKHPKSQGAHPYDQTVCWDFQYWSEGLPEHP